MLKANRALPRATVEESCSMAVLCLLRVLSCWSEAITDLSLLFFFPEDALHGNKRDILWLLNIFTTSQGQTKVVFALLTFYCISCLDQLGSNAALQNSYTVVMMSSQGNKCVVQRNSALTSATFSNSTL